MSHPELARGLVRMRKCEAGGERVRKECRVEVEANPQIPGPIDPSAEMLRSNPVALDLAAAEVAVRRVQVEAMFPGNERERLGRVLTQFISGAGFTGIVPGRREAAADLRRRRFESADVVSLPAVNRDRHGRERLQCGVRVDTKVRVLLFSQVVRRLDLLVAHLSLERRLALSRESASLLFFGFYSLYTLRNRICRCLLL